MNYRYLNLILAFLGIAMPLYEEGLIPSAVVEEGLIPSAVVEEGLIPSAVVGACIENYSDLEKSLIDKDLSIIEEMIFEEGIVSNNKWYVGTAGAPGAGKSTALEVSLREDSFLKDLSGTYIDPDQRALRFMVHTYGQSTCLYERTKVLSWEDVYRNAYLKWRGASNYIANMCLNRAFREGYNIIHGTTATTPYIGNFYSKLKNAGYKIYLQLYFAEDITRQHAVDYRHQFQRFIQSTEEDFQSKASGFFNNMSIYFNFADHIDLYWMDHNNDNEIPLGAEKVAYWNYEKGIVVLNAFKYEEIVKNFDRFEGLGAWEQCMNMHKGEVDF